MTIPPTGNEREGGFLQKNERAFLAEQGCYPLPYSDDIESGGRQARSRIRNEVSNVEGMRRIVSGMDIDLEALLLFMLRDEKTDWKRWANTTLPEIQHELEQLQNTLDRLIEIAKDDSLQSEYEEIQEVTADLYDDADRAMAGISGGVLDMRSASEEDSSEFIWEEFEERVARQEGLMTLVYNEGAVQVLEYVSENGPGTVPKEKRGTDYMASIATNKLQPSGLVNKEYIELWDKYEYEITDRGQAVLAVWNNLTNTRAVEMEREQHSDGTTRELVRDALEFHFDLSDDPPYPF